MGIHHLMNRVLQVTDNALLIFYIILIPLWPYDYCDGTQVSCFQNTKLWKYGRRPH